MPKKNDLLEQFAQAVYDKLKADEMPASSVVVEDPRERRSVVIVDLRDVNIPVITGDKDKMQHIHTSIAFAYGTVAVFQEVEL